MGLVPHWRLWWRRWSTWGAAANAALWATLTGQSGLLLGFLPFLPVHWHIPMAALVFVLAFILPVVLAHLKQPKLEAKCEAAKDA